MHKLNIILQAVTAACGDFLRDVGCSRLELTHYPAEAVHNDVISVEKRTSMFDSGISYRVVTYLNKKIYHCNFYDGQEPYSDNLEVVVYRLRDIGEQAASQLCNSIFKDVPSLTHSVLSKLPVYIDMCRELRNCPEELPNWLLEPGLQYHVAKNFIESEKSYEHL